MNNLRGDSAAPALRAARGAAAALVAALACIHVARADEGDAGWRSATAEKFAAATDQWADQASSTSNRSNAKSDSRRTTDSRSDDAKTGEKSFRRSTKNQAAGEIRQASHLQTGNDGLPRLDDPFEDDPVLPEPQAGRSVLGDRGREPLYYDPRGEQEVWNGGCGAEPGCGVDACGCGDGGGSCGVGPCRFCPPWRCGPPARVWARADYLMWWTKGMETPPLVTTATAGTPRFADPNADPRVPVAGVLGDPNTTILYGGEDLFDELRSGGRLTGGIGLDWCRGLGIEAEWFVLGTDHERFLGVSFNGDPILARPFFNPTEIPNTSTDPPPDDNNSLASGPSRELVGFPDVIEGTVRVAAQSSLNSYGIRFRHNLCCGGVDLGPCCADTCCLQNVSQGATRWDFIWGYRHVDLDDSIGIREDLFTLDFIPPESQQRIIVRDGFSSSTEFNGVDVGLAYEFHRCRWSMDLLAKIAFGNNHQRVRINGSTENTADGMTTQRVGGLLAQTTNIGNYENDQFSVIPEVGVNLGYRLTNHITLKAGYTFMYWTNVVRAAEQIDLNVDARFLASAVVPGATQPAFAFHTTDFWAHGLNFGAECRW